MGFGHEPITQADLNSKTGLAEARARDAKGGRSPIEGEDIHWPVARVVRIAALIIGLLIVVSWLIVALNS